MNKVKEIQQLHNKGFVILKAQRSTNAPIGWKHKDGKWGYVEEMQDAKLARYKQTFDPHGLAKSHCGFYLGHNNLCCIDLDVKKTQVAVKDIVDKIIAAFGKSVCVETTKSAGFHIYFKYKTDLPNDPDFTVSRVDNWIEVYYRSRFIASYLSNTKAYNLVHGDVLGLEPLTDAQHKALLKFFAKWKGVRPKPKKAKPVVIDNETMVRCEAYVKQIESRSLDITGDNPRWFRIGKALSSAFGDAGFDMFNRLSRFSPLYNADTIKDDYQNFVDGEKKDREGKITILTFFHLCEEHGLLPLETEQAMRLNPATVEKEFTIEISRKERIGTHVYKVITMFRQVVPICCVDKANYYIFEDTHWRKKNTSEVLKVIADFIDRAEVDADLAILLKTVPYNEMYLKELQHKTLRNSLEPNTGDLKNGIFINMENGVLHIDMKTGKRKLLDHSPDYNFTTLLPYAYEPLVTSPKFDEWMARQLPDAAMHEVYYAFVASCLTKHKADIIMLLAGDTSTGKSSLIDITRRIVGIENSAAVSAGTLFSGKPEATSMAMQMENKLLAYDFDAQPFRHLEMLLKVAAQEPIQGWQMHVTRREVTNYGRLILAMNPQNYSVFNAAVARRFVTLNMDVPVVKDNSVMPAIYENEMAGIFNHVLNIGVKHLLANGGQIKQTTDMRKATVDFHTKERDAVRWFNEHYAQIDYDKLSKNNKTSLEVKIRKAYGTPPILVSMSEMYQAYRLWMEMVEGHSPNKLPIRKYFVSDLKAVGIEEKVFKIDGIPNRGLYVLKASLGYENPNLP